MQLLLLLKREHCGFLFKTLLPSRAGLGPAVHSAGFAVRGRAGLRQGCPATWMVPLLPILSHLDRFVQCGQFTRQGGLITSR